MEEYLSFETSPVIIPASKEKTEYRQCKELLLNDTKIPVQQGSIKSEKPALLDAVQCQ